ncbi:MAG: transglycosylase family protein [Gordonia sp. (in: high G+C Gram-positive bacteria)]|uniref:transglycosylase family protein n=1 Tax=Gordonia sp. (in: high G+C Gram-positive bacteria) TaxID=84139 RepID=UPI0039E450D0
MARHAKPSNSNTKTFAKVALTSAVIGGGAAMMSAGAGGASAASDAEWERVAQCESGGNWAINTGNGYHGGLQFSPSTWAGHGGTQFAPTADKATKQQQIYVAEKVLKSQGKGAWPTCGTHLSGPTERQRPGSTPSIPNPFDKLINPRGNGSAANTDEAIDQAKTSSMPEVAAAAREAEKAGFKLDQGQLNLFNQNKDKLGVN